MQVWYAGYGSNLSGSRFRCYLEGGRPVGAVRTMPGARDRTPPTRELRFAIPGQVFFGGESRTWGGGTAFLDAEAQGQALARAYLVTAAQFADIAAQEMRRDPGPDLDLETVLRDSQHTLGPGPYETLHLVGELDDAPVLTFSAADPRGIPSNRPSAAYLRMIATGLRETHGLAGPAIAEYVMACPGIGDWTHEAIEDLAAAPAASG